MPAGSPPRRFPYALSSPTARAGRAPFVFSAWRTPPDGLGRASRRTALAARRIAIRLLRRTLQERHEDPCHLGGVLLVEPVAGVRDDHAGDVRRVLARLL